MKKTLLAISLFVSSSFFALAQGSVVGGASSPVTGGTGVGPTSVNPTGLVNLIALAQTVVSRLVPFLVGLAVVAFFWFLVEFIWKGRDNPDEQRKAVSGMSWSILALFVMVSVWGIIGFIATMLGINVGGTMSGFKLPGEQ